MALVLHHLEKSRSHRILWLFEELGLAYELREYKRDPATFRADPALKQVHPLGKAPIVTDGELVLAETGAILEHVLEHHGGGRLVPAGERDRIDYRYFMHYAEGSLMPPLLVRLIFTKLGEAKVPFFVRPIVNGIVDKVEANFTRAELRSHAAFLDAHLAAQPYFAGSELSAADIQMSYPVLALVDRGGLPEADTRHLRDWANRIQARPAYAAALAKGGALF